jgi:Xaa-Pro aminopeptidase
MDTPFSPDVYALRLDRLARDAAGAELSGLLLTPGPDMAYACGYRPPITERLTLLVISPEQEPVMIVPQLDRGDAEKCPGASRLRLVDWPDGANPYAVAREILGDLRTFAITDSAWALHVLGLQQTVPEVRYTSITHTVPMLRAIKDEAELARLDAASSAVDSAYNEIVKTRFEGRTELEVAADLAALLTRFGHETVAFTLVCSGPNGADPHHLAGERVIAAGDMVIMDFGGLLDGYCSDTTRTVHVGEASAQEREVYDVVRAAQQAALEAVRPGMTCQEIDRVARRIITEAGYGEYFVHRTGHGIGMSTHEPPYLVEGEEHLLVPGMCFSIQPGIYLKGRFGVRVEDIVTVTDTGGRRLNESSREMAIVA